MYKIKITHNKNLILHELKEKSVFVKSTFFSTAPSNARQNFHKCQKVVYSINKYFFIQTKISFVPTMLSWKVVFQLCSISAVEEVRKISFFLMHSKKITVVLTRDLAPFLTAHCLHILSQLPCAFLPSALQVFTVLKIPYIISDKKYLFKRKSDEIR